MRMKNVAAATQMAVKVLGGSGENYDKYTWFLIFIFFFTATVDINTYVFLSGLR